MTQAELAILGLILERPRHGYEIEQVIEERGMREWTEVGFSSIYYVLNKLEAQGLITSSLEQTAGRGPARKVYQITNPGVAAWREATLEALAVPQKRYAQFLLGLVGLPAIPAKLAIAALDQYCSQLRAEQERVRDGQRSSGDSLPLFLEGMFDYSLTLLEAELKWVQSFIGRLESQLD